jgi:hypothetical protein
VDESLYPSGAALRNAITALGTVLAFSRNVGIPYLVLSKRLNDVTADGSGNLGPTMEAMIAAGLGPQVLTVYPLMYGIGPAGWITGYYAA